MERSDIINHLIKQYNYKSYLEIGYGTGYTFNKINIENKVGVDGGNGTPSTDTVVVRMRSEDYFKLALEQEFDKFDIIFIDGLHEEKQTDRDIANSLKCLTDNGIIVCHDILPEIFEQVYRAPNTLGGLGNSYLSFAKLRTKNKNLSMCSLDFANEPSTQEGIGIGIIKKGHQVLYPLSMDDGATPEEKYKFYADNKQNLMNIVKLSRFKEWLDAN